MLLMLTSCLISIARQWQRLHMSALKHHCGQDLASMQDVSADWRLCRACPAAACSLLVWPASSLLQSMKRYCANSPAQAASAFAVNAVEASSDQRPVTKHAQL